MTYIYYKIYTIEMRCSDLLNIKTIVPFYDLFNRFAPSKATMPLDRKELHGMKMNNNDNEKEDD